MLVLGKDGLIRNHRGTSERDDFHTAVVLLKSEILSRLTVLPVTECALPRRIASIGLFITTSNILVRRFLFVTLIQ